MVSYGDLNNATTVEKWLVTSLRIATYSMRKSCEITSTRSRVAWLLNDPLFPHAEESTIRAKELNAHFSEEDSSNASLHAWLAWQKEPGLPYGSAIRARYFRHDSQAAQSFVIWFRELFGIDPGNETTCKISA